MSGRKMVPKNKSTIYIIGGAVILLLIGAYVYLSSYVDRQAKQETNQAHRPSTSEGLSQYEHSLVGDNNAVLSIIGALPEGKYIDKIELQTESEPYGIKLHGTDDLTAEGVDAMSSQLLRLVDNCEWVEINTGQFRSKVTRDGPKEFSVIN